MFISGLTVGASIDIIVEREDEKFVFPSHIQDVAKNQVAVLFPMKDGKYFDFMEKDIVKVRYISEGRVLSWICEDWGGTTKGSLNLLYAVASTIAQNTNLRSAFRVGMNVQATAQTDTQIFPVFVKDISLNGAGFHALKEMNVGEEVTVSLTDSETSALYLRLKIVRIEPSERSFFYGASILATDEGKLTRLIQEKQILELRKRRMKAS